MKVIFLDIDGVLATRGSISAWHTRMTEITRSGSTEDLALEMDIRMAPGGKAGELDQACVDLFLRLLEQTGACVVLSSSWRYDKRNNKIWQDLFGDKWLGRTGPDLDAGRGADIQTWLSKHPEVDKFVILDDEDSDMGEMTKFVVKTEMVNGFTDWQFSQCMQRLT
jgi:hypothetical protein